MEEVIAYETLLKKHIQYILLSASSLLPFLSMYKITTTSIFKTGIWRENYHSVAFYNKYSITPDNKVYGTYMGPTWGRQDTGGPHVDPRNLAILDAYTMFCWPYVA